MRCEVGGFSVVQFACGCPLTLFPFDGETIFQPRNYLCMFAKNQLHILIWVSTVPLIYCQYHTEFINHIRTVKIREILFLIFKIGVAILIPLLFHVSFF